MSFPLHSTIRFTDTPRTKSEPSGLLGTCKSAQFPRIRSDNSLLSYTSYGWPVRSVEQVPPPNPKQLKVPVLIIGNTVRAPHSRTDLPRSLTTTIPRLIPSPRMRTHKTPPTSLATVRSYSNNSASVTRASLSPRLALLASWSITSQTPRLVFVSNVWWLRGRTDLLRNY